MNGRLDFASRGALASIAAVAALAMAASCTQDFDQFFEGTTAPTTTTPTGTGGSGGGSGECAAPEDCDGTDTTCQQRTCVNEVCGTSYANAGTACTEDGGAVCDGTGSCVECTNETHCDTNEVCDDNSCVASACVNDTQDGEETDVDCGGPDCNPCVNTETCLLARDCVSRFCDSSSGAGGGGGSGSGDSVCAPCVNDIDCSGATDTWCNTNVDDGSCVDKTPDGGACSGANQCQSGFCPPGDNVCCDTTCQQTCRACLQSKTGTADGTCDYVTADTDPDAECTATDPSTCGAAGLGCEGSTAACILYGSSTECAAQSCTGNLLRPARDCNGSGNCDTVQSSACPDGYMCNSAGTDCLTSCQNNGDCVSDHWCDTNDSTCKADKADGQPCSSFLECINASCPSPEGICCNTACNRDCESCAAADTGGTDGVCGPIPAGTADPTGACSPYVAPCGGELCNGSSSSPACEGVCDSCNTLYAGHGSVQEVCSDVYDECVLRATTSSVSCREICESGGGECLGVRDNVNNTSCVETGGPISCDATGANSIICTCSHGCGTNPPCTQPDTCSSGTCG
ncbi:MAG: hypothetical protein JRI23_27580 [Deltaproteobacteria bacterium]|jgi:hypothetical protein|nr:hypothetical protein [Deltaproteobacteria bacterium]MBW2535842.1 hypothetical protein [Deltaproteobacteria bacterium]